MTRIAIAMPQLGYDMATGKISSWLKSIGDRVERGEAIAEIETDKSTIEMEALASGILVQILHGPGSEVSVGDAIAELETEP